MTGFPGEIHRIKGSSDGVQKNFRPSRVHKSCQISAFWNDFKVILKLDDVPLHIKCRSYGRPTDFSGVIRWYNKICPTENPSPSLTAARNYGRLYHHLIQLYRWRLRRSRYCCWLKSLSIHYWGNRRTLQFGGFKTPPPGVALKIRTFYSLLWVT